MAAFMTVIYVVITIIVLMGLLSGGVYLYHICYNYYPDLYTKFKIPPPKNYWDDDDDIAPLNRTKLEEEGLSSPPLPVKRADHRSPGVQRNYPVTSADHPQTYRGHPGNLSPRQQRNSEKEGNQYFEQPGNDQYVKFSHESEREQNSVSYDMDLKDNYYSNPHDESQEPGNEPLKYTNVQFNRAGESPHLVADDTNLSVPLKTSPPPHSSQGLGKPPPPPSPRPFLKRENPELAKHRPGVTVKPIVHKPHANNYVISNDIMLEDLGAKKHNNITEAENSFPDPPSYLLATNTNKDNYLTDF